MDRNIQDTGALFIKSVRYEATSEQQTCFQPVWEGSGYLTWVPQLIVFWNGNMGITIANKQLANIHLWAVNLPSNTNLSNLTSQDLTY